MNEFNEAMNNVIDYGVKVIDSLPPEQLAQVLAILDKVK